MAVPAYTEDLTDIDLAESLTGWSDYNASGGGGASALGADFSTQGTNCLDRAASNTERGMLFNNGATSAAVATGVHIFQWLFVATPGITDTLANKGACVCVGTSGTAFTQFHVEGSNTYGAQGRVAKCYVVRYNTTANTGSVPYRTLIGTPGATPAYFGATIKTIATVKGSNIGTDANRYGTGAYLTAGELISAGDGSDDPCTFVGFNTQNDAVANRWGILTSIGGANYELQGRFVIGQNNAKTPTLARFRDNNNNISFVDTVHSETDFSQIIIDHASTRAEFTNISLTGLGTNNPGRFVVNAANPTVSIVNGTWTSIGLTTLRSNTTVTGLTWRGTAQIVQNGAIIQDGLVDSSSATAAILATNPTNIKRMEFISSGAGHAVQCDTVGTYNWDGNTDSGYSGTGTDATFYNNSGGLITLNVVNGGAVPSVRNGASATTTVNASVSVSIAGVTRGTPVKLIARETLGSITSGDVLSEQFAAANGTITYSHNDEGSLSISVVARNQGVAVAAIADDGGVFVDETNQASSNTTADMLLLPTTPVVNDAYYFGHNEQFNRLKLDITTARVGTLTVTWEYWNGAWVALSGVSDLTTGFSVAGANIVSFTLPGDWALTSVTNQANVGTMYYVRARVSAFTSQSTAPVGRKVTLDVSRYLPYDAEREVVTGVGLTDNASWRRDTISKFDPND